MILRWLISFSLLVLAASGAEVSGQVSLRDSREASVRKDGDFSGVVISLQPLDSREPQAPPVRHARMLQKNKTFTPHILPVQVGTLVDFPNADPIFHNAFSSYSGQIFDIGLYPPGTSRSVRFGRSGVVRVFCNIHPSMSAIIIALNTPYFTQTLRDGKFSMVVPPGRYTLRVFHERATEQSLVNLAREIQVGSEPVTVPPIEVSEAGYLLAPHKNKYGRSYSTEGDDRSIYPGVRK